MLTNFVMHWKIAAEFRFTYLCTNTCFNIMNHRFRNVVIALILASGILVSVWLWVRLPVSDNVQNKAPSHPTPISGTLVVALDRSLLEIASLQARRFSEIYPDAAITFSDRTTHPLVALFDRKADAILVEGELTSREDSVMHSFNRPVKSQPVARNALVLVVHRSNTIHSLSIEELQSIFSGKTTTWQALGGSPGSIIACIDGSDPRLSTLLSERLFRKQQHLFASSEPDRQKLIDRLRIDPDALCVMTLADWAKIVRTRHDIGALRTLQLALRRGEVSVDATSETLYSGAYPLSTIVYYLYDPYNPLATGFGAWLASEGQKLFERGDMAPYQQIIRTIILK
jgi:phosphate transport system substrate-binding protein